MKMELFSKNRRIWIPVLLSIIISIISLVIIRNNKMTDAIEDIAMTASLDFVPSQPHKENNKMQIPVSSNVDSAEKIKSDIIRQLQPEAENLGEKKRETNNKYLAQNIITRSKEGATVDEKIEILESYMNHPDLTEKDQYLLNREIAILLVMNRDYGAASKIFDEMEVLCKGDDNLILEIKMNRAKLDYIQGDSESAIKKLTEITDLPVPVNDYSSAQTRQILLLAPSMMANIYKSDGNIDKSINLIHKTIEKCIKIHEQHLESKDLIYIFVNLYGYEIDFELSDNRISVKEARNRLDEIVVNIISKSKMSEKELSSLTIVPVGDIHSMIDNYERKEREKSAVKSFM